MFHNLNCITRKGGILSSPVVWGWWSSFYLYCKYRKYALFWQLDHMCVLQQCSSWQVKGVKIFHYLAGSFSNLNRIRTVSSSCVSFFFFFPGFNVVPQRNIKWRFHCMYDEGMQQWDPCLAFSLSLRFSLWIPTLSGWVGPRAGLSAAEKRKITGTEYQFLSCPARSLVAVLYCLGLYHYAPYIQQ